MDALSISNVFCGWDELELGSREVGEMFEVLTEKVNEYQNKGGMVFQEKGAGTALVNIVKTMKNIDLISDKFSDLVLDSLD